MHERGAITQKFLIHFASDASSVRTVVKNALVFLRAAYPSLSPDELIEFKLVFSELLHNAVVHGNGNDRLKNVKFEIELNGDTVLACVADEGSGFNYKGVIDKFDCDDIFSESGRGIMLAYKLTDKLFFDMPGNVIHFRKRVTFRG
ncbi:MAG: ATP-binding protein [Clostridiales bacterium]|nr:ATP-binding protein [Clostridiales bacterium]